ncbi:ATP-binding cassette domain-containing protein [Acetobacteraceae bacterium H6797]|nr:ATP-binding cassette domain-containing protein [Acetobacteraceae bacterium H6797]
MSSFRPIIGLFLAGPRRLLLLGLLLAALTTLAGMLLLGLSGWFITATGIAGLSAATAMAFDVFSPSAGIRALALGRTAARYGERVTTHDATLAILAALRERLLRGWATPGAARGLLARPARLLFRLTGDVDALDNLYLRLLVPAVTVLGAILIAGFALGLLHPALGLGLAALMLALAIALPLWAARRGQAEARRKGLATEALRARSIDLVAGQTELALAGRLPAQHRSLLAAEARLAEAEAALHRTETRAGLMLGGTASLALAGVLMGAALLVHEDVLNAPQAAFALLITLAAFEPFGALKRGALELGRTRLAARRLAPRLAPQPAPAAPAEPEEGIALRLDRATAGHEGRAVLRDISLTVRTGEHVAIIGSSGAGKSTLLALIAGEIEPMRGHVESLRHARLSQATHLFQESLRANLLLADPDADDARLWRALESAGLAETFRTLPQGLDTQLGESGLGLSGGQRRRLALARMLLRDAPLWLLDEPTEGLDGPLARAVLRQIKALAGEKSIVTSTHVRREAEAADRLIVLTEGKITATHRRGEPGYHALLASLRSD